MPNSSGRPEAAERPGSGLPARRLEGWEARLAAAIEEARGWTYALGERDCFRFACEVVRALTGVDRWPEFAGRYRTRREALVLIARHGASAEAAGGWFFGSGAQPPTLARRGDILLLATPDGEHHLGVCNGSQAAFLKDDGLVFVPISGCLKCWRVG